ncbi:LD-carboxypeptidase [Streptomyces sp. NPDC049040]|uniref:LD-carboxypeptidase n=1 Tax=Streptomyces sp. NPDC049040 TaxID=3365593 RepID=UPI0037212C63
MTRAAPPGPPRPRALAPGDLVVIAPLSGPLHTTCEPDLRQAVAGSERMGFRVRLAPLLEAGRHHRWSAARPAEITREPNTPPPDPEFRALVAHDGDQTALDCLDLIDIEAIAADPKPILGHPAGRRIDLRAEGRRVPGHAVTSAPPDGGHPRTSTR